MTDQEKMVSLIVQAKKEDPETGSFTEFLAGFLLRHGVSLPATPRSGPRSPYIDDNILACPCCGSGEYLENEDGNENRFCGQCLDWRRLPEGDACRRETPMLEVCPITLKEANTFVEQHHRHHKPVAGHKFSIGCTDGEKIVGVAIVGRPVSRYLDDGWTLEVNRLCTDGTRNACSMLYAAAWRAARAMGYHKLITYILDSEHGTSLKAAGWRCVGQAGGLRWTGKRQPTVDLCPAQMKIRFEIDDGKHPQEALP